MSSILDNYLFDAFAHSSDNTYIYVTDMKENLSRWSPDAIEYFDLGNEYLIDAKDIWLERVHPDDRQLYLDDINAVFNGSSKQHNCQYRAMNRYGEYVWLECRGSVINDEDGNPIVFAGMMTRLDHQSKYDSLTHLLTGYELFRKPVKESGALMLVGIDAFRNINNQYGLVYGNKLLIHLADILTKHVPDSTVYRFRGDEFAIHSSNLTSSDMLNAFNQIEACCKISDNCDGLHSFSVSAGIVDYDDNENDITEIISRAELCLAHAKENSGPRVAVYTDEIAKKHARKTLVSEWLAKSVKNNFEGFYLVYQPILSNAGDTVIGCEALLRWNPNNEDIGACYPDEFISILENNGGIIDVGYFVMKESIRQAAEWQKRYKGFNVSFNVSYLQLQDPKFVPAILDTVKQHDIDPAHVIVELTESVLAADTDMVRTSFELLKKHRIKIALDDFGTGNSSFWTLHNIDIDILKLDQAFIRGLERDSVGIDYAIVESVGLMCDRIGCMTVAEGVENDDIWKLISKFDFTGLQGYLFSRPVEVPAFEEFLDKYNMSL